MRNYNERNTAIDILRALTMLLMIFVNDLWSIEGEPEWLGHSAPMQDFMGLADIVFPCFLVAVGMSIPYAIEKRMAKGYSGVSTVGHILSRSLALLVMGLFTVNSEESVACITGMGTAWFRILMVIGFFLIWNVYPRKESKSHIFSILKWVGVALLTFLAITYRTESGSYFQSSWWGILGIIGWTYLVCAMMYLFTRDRLRYLIPAWCVLTLICILKSTTHSGETLLDIPGANIFDQALGILHLGNGCSAALTTGGIIISVITVKYELLANTRRRLIFGMAGCAAILLGCYVSHLHFIFSKIMATAPWLFANLAIMIGAYTLLISVVNAGYARIFDVIKPAGTSTLTCYVIPYVTYSISALCGIVLPLWLRSGAVGILNCIVYAFFIIGITYLINKVGIKLKV